MVPANDVRTTVHTYYDRTDQVYIREKIIGLSFKSAYFSFRSRHE